MSDIEVIEIDATDVVTLDYLLLSDGSLSTARELATAVRVALGTDRLANRDDTLPRRGDTNRRGWWGDLDSQEIYGVDGIGSRLWLLQREKITDANARQGATIAKVESYIREALAFLKTLKIASRIDVAADRIGTTAIGATVTIYRGPLTAIELRFQPLWADIAG